MTEAEKRRESRLIRVYGITLKDYYGILELQGNCCPICFAKYEPGKRFSVDHNHEPPYEVRAIVCYRCNRYRIGSLNVDLAWKIYSYLTNPPATKYFGEAHPVPVGMEKGQKKTRKRRTTVKRNLRKK